MKSFIIHLSKIETSLKTATALQQKLTEFDLDSELFEGTYGNDAVKLMEEEGRIPHPWGIKGPPKEDLPPSTEINHWSPGIQGCFYSHYRLWQKCVDLAEPIIIWEDDIDLRRGLIKIDWQDVLVLALGHPKKSEKYKNYLEDPEGDAYAAEYHQSSMPGNCGYAIKPHAAKKLLKVYKNTYLPADNAINQYHVKIQIHSHVMGIALTKKDGKKSLTRSHGFWEKFK